MMENTTIWTALADSKRRRIISLLAETPRTTNNLTEFFDVSRFAIMKHLNVLEQANLIEVKREGRIRWNILNESFAQFLRTKFTHDDDNEPYQLTDISDLFPKQQPTAVGLAGKAVPFCVEQSISLRASRSQVFEMLIDGIDAWWWPRVAADSRIMIEPQVNGRFYEAFNHAGQGVLYGIITYIKQDEELRIAGTTELTEQMADVFLPHNALSITLKTDGENTQLTLKHNLSGLTARALGDSCAHHWHNLLHQRFKPFVEEEVSEL